MYRYINMDTTKPRYEHFDIFKGIAIFLVLCGHIYSFSLFDSYDSIGDKLSVMSLIRSIHMPMFVFVSGYFATKGVECSWKGGLTYWKDKSLRLLLPLLGFPLIYIFISGDGIVNLFDLTKYWFTPALFLIFIPFYVARFVSGILNIGRKVDTVVMLLSVVVVFSTLTYIVKYIELPSLMSLLIKNVKWLYLYMILGYIFACHQELDYWVRKQWVIVVSFALFLAGHIYILRSGLGDILEGMRPVSVMLSVTGIICMYNLCLSLSTQREREVSRLGFITSGLASLGRESLPIYLTHYFFIPRLPFILDMFAEYNTYTFFAWEVLMYLFGACIVLVPTLICIRVIKTSPLLALIFYGERWRR